MPEKTEQNPSGSPLGKFSLLNPFIRAVDKLTGYDRSKEYYQPKKNYQKPRKAGLDKTT
jgi:hypothetical protein